MSRRRESSASQGFGLGCGVIFGVVFAVALLVGCGFVGCGVLGIGGFFGAAKVSEEGARLGGEATAREAAQASARVRRSATPVSPPAP